MSKNNDNYEIYSEQELQKLENELGGMFSELGPAPVREGFAEELRSRLIDSLETADRTEEVKREGFFLTPMLDGIKRKKDAPVQPAKQRTRSGKIRLVAAVALVIFICTAVFQGLGGLGIFLKPVQAGEIQITALKEDEAGVDPDTAFLLTSEVALDRKTVEENLKISPAVEYKLEKQAGGKKYKIVPQQKLAADTVYKLSFDLTGQGRESFSWAFQTKGQFRVLRTLPANGTSSVPVNTGIEIVFSHDNFSQEEAAKYVKISPQVKGRFEKHGKTLVFVPEALQEKTIYTVTVLQGLPLAGSNQAIAEDYQFAFETQAKEEDRNEFAFDISAAQTEFTTAEAPVFPVYYYEQAPETKARVEIYRYQDVDSYLAVQAKLAEIPFWAYYARKDFREDLSKLAKHSQYDIDIIDTDQYTHYVVTPEPLPAGFYAVRIKIGEAEQQAWFQVNDLGVYMARSRESAVFWVHNLLTGAPVQGAQVTVYKQKGSCPTDQDGVALIKEGFQYEKGGFALVQSGGQTLAAALDDGFSYYSKDDPYLVRMDYWKYLYLDREIYKPGDTINYWGIVSPRKGAEKLSQVTLELYGSEGVYYEGAERKPILVQQHKLEGQTFTGQVKLPNLRPGYYYFSVKSGETELLSRGFSVETYTKHSYQLTLEPEKKAIFAGEKINFKVRTSFFEGTPVPGLKLSYYVEGQQGTVVTDMKGEALIPYTGSVYNNFGSPNTAYMYVNASLPEAGEIGTYSYVYVFNSSVKISREIERKGQSFTLRVSTNKVDLSRINEGEYWSYDYLAGEAPYTEVKGKVYKDIWEQYEAGQYYDYINKKVMPRYEYTHTRELTGEFTIRTGHDGTAVYTGQLADPEATYYIELTATDSQGRASSEMVYIYSPDIGYYPGYDYYHLKADKEEGYQSGEIVRLSFLKNEYEMEGKPRSFLFYQAQKELLACSIQDKASYSFTFNEDMIPNIYVIGVYFDGRTYQEAQQVIRIKPESKGLLVTVTTDKEEYRPGDKVQLQVQVTDLQGKPVQAELNLNLVDEALYSLSEQRVNLLESLYQDYIYPNLYSWHSHHTPQYPGGAEGGEGGGARTNFQDTVLFVTLRTGRDGKAAADFTLPDNLTSWRLTYHAVTEDLLAASGTEKIPVRLPFFVDLVLNENYYAGDKPVIILRAYGEKISSGQQLTYETSITAPDGQTSTATGRAQAFAAYDWALPVLKEGEYTLQVTATCGSYKDTVVRKISVTRPVLERTVTWQNLLAAGTPIEGSAEMPTTVIFSDYEKSQYLRGLTELAWSSGSRVEQQLAVREARKLLQQYFPEEAKYWFREAEEISLLDYQQGDGGISILPYSSSELYLSALAASYSPEEFDRQALVGYFYRILEGKDASEDDRTLALWGLAALDQPVLLQIKKELQRQDLQPAEQIQLAMALLELGDGAYGKKVFRQIIGQYAEDLGTTMRIKGPDNQEDILLATTQTALLAARLDEPEKGKLYQYLLENLSQESLNYLEKLQILKYSLQYMQARPVSFKYELNGKSEHKSLQGQETLQLTLLPEDLTRIKFSGIEGKIGVTSIYQTPLLPGETAQGEDLSLRRTYKVNDKAVQRVQRGDLVQVVIEYKIGDRAPGGNYEIIDMLPSGLAYVARPVGNRSYLENLAFPSEVKGQQLAFTVPKGNGKLIYYARVVSPGEYECGAPYLGHSTSREIYLTGNTDRIVIQ